MPIQELLVLHHSHMDIGYTHPQPVVWELHDRYIDEAIDLCEKTANYPEGSRCKWTCEVTNVVLHWLESASEAQVARLKKLVKNGQISFGAMLCHWTALHSEDLLKESLQPMNRLREVLGAKFEVAMQTDVNGVPWSTPDLLLDAGVKQLMMSINMHMGGFPLSRPALFRWQTPSGREVTVFSGEHYNAFGREVGLNRPDLSLERVEQGLKHYFTRLKDKGWSHDFAILTATHPMMDDNGPPNPELPELVRRWNAAGKTPFIRIASVDEVFKKIATINKKKIPLHSGDWTDFWTSGAGASALDVAMSRRAMGALWGAKALATQIPPEAQLKLAPKLDATAEMLHLANEHTWNTYASTGALGVAGSGKMEPVPEAEQRLWKSGQCAGALSHARLHRRDLLDALAGNPAQSRTQEGLLLFNPSELPRTVCLRVTPDLAAGGYHLIGGTKHRLDVIEDNQRDTSATGWVGPVEVPPLSVKTVKLKDLNCRNFSSGLTRSKGGIGSRFWRLQYNEETGAVTSLVHLATGRECFDPAAGFDLFGPVRESVAKPSARARKLNDPRYDLFHVSEADFDEIVHSDVDAWATDWPAQHERPTCIGLVEALIDAEGAHLIRHLEMPGAKGEMKQTLTLLAYEDRVRFEAFFNKADETDPESLFFTFPFKADNPQAHFDTCGVAVAYDKEQLPGACRDWLTAESFVAIESKKNPDRKEGDKNSTGCLTLACPDAPLFQLGGFNYARRLRDVSKINQALVIAWPTNNYWDTNFRASQPGYLRFRYELICTPTYNPAQAARFGAAMGRPVMFHPVVATDQGASDRALIANLPDSVTVVSLKPDQDGSIHVGLRNHATKPVSASPRFPGRAIAAMMRINPLGAHVQSPKIGKSLILPARATTWLRIAFAPISE